MGVKDIITIKGNLDLERLANRLAELIMAKQADKNPTWITEHEVMAITGLKSKGQIMKIRQQGLVKYTQPYKRVIMYDKQSVLDFLNKHVRQPFGQ